MKGQLLHGERVRLMAHGWLSDFSTLLTGKFTLFLWRLKHIGVMKIFGWSQGRFV